MSKRDQRANKHQHWVAASYLKAWCDPNSSMMSPHVYRFTKDGSSFKAKSPKKTFAENDLYTFRRADGSRDLRLEQMYGMLETQFVEARKRIEISRHFAGEDAAHVMAFMAAQISRTPRFRDHQAEQWGRVVALGEEMEQRIRAMSPEQRKNAATTSLPGKRGKSMSLDQVRAARDHPFHYIGIPVMMELLRAFSRMRSTLLVCNDPVGFITSDAPCVAFDPELHKLPPIWRNISFYSPTVEITLPISPGLMALLTWNEDMPSLLPAVGEMLDHLNYRRRVHCHREFVSRSRNINPYWLRTFFPPDDDDEGM